MELKRIQWYETCYLETRLVILEEMTKWIGGIWKLLISVDLSLMKLFDFQNHLSDIFIRLLFILHYLPKHKRDGKRYIWQILTKENVVSSANTDKIKFEAKKLYIYYIYIYVLLYVYIGIGILLLIIYINYKI